jgi:hypothetical protein
MLFCGFKLNVVMKNRDFCLGSGTNAENIINILKKRIQRGSFYKQLMQGH